MGWDLSLSLFSARPDARFTWTLLSVLIVGGINAQLAARFEFSRRAHDADEIPGQVVRCCRRVHEAPRISPHSPSLSSPPACSICN